MGLSEQAERRDASTYPIRGMKAKVKYNGGMKASKVISQAHEGLGRIPRPPAARRLVVYVPLAQGG